MNRDKKENDIPQGVGAEDFGYDMIEVTNPGEMETPDTDSHHPLEPQAHETFDSKVSRLFNSLEELNEALAFLTATPQKREDISENPKYLKEDQIEFLITVILSPVTTNSLFEILATKAALEKAILNIFEAMAEKDEAD